MSSSSTRRQQEHSTITNTNNNQQQQQQDEQHQATVRSIDETKNNIHQAIDELRRETPRYAQNLQIFKPRQ